MHPDIDDIIEYDTKQLFDILQYYIDTSLKTMKEVN